MVTLLVMIAMGIAAPSSNAPTMAAIAGDGIRVKDFSLGIREVTWAEYALAVDSGSCAMPQNGYKKPIAFGHSLPRDNYPVTGVTANDVKCYLSWLNRQTGRNFRLPTSAEWLWSARNAQPRHWTSMQRALAASQVRSDPRLAVSEATVNRTGTSAPTNEGVYDLEANAKEMLSETRVMDSPDYKRLCAKYGRGLCRQSAVIGSSAYNVEHGIEKPDDFRKILWMFQGDPMTSVGFRLAEDH